jgi:hypothetical protein
MSVRPALGSGFAILKFADAASQVLAVGMRGEAQ